MLFFGDYLFWTIDFESYLLLFPSKLFPVTELYPVLATVGFFLFFISYMVIYSNLTFFSKSTLIFWSCDSLIIIYPLMDKFLGISVCSVCSRLVFKPVAAPTMVSPIVSWMAIFVFLISGDCSYYLSLTPGILEASPLFLEMSPLFYFLDGKAFLVTVEIIIGIKSIWDLFNLYRARDFSTFWRVMFSSFSTTCSFWKLLLLTWIPEETLTSTEFSSKVASINFVAVTVLVIVLVFISSGWWKTFNKVSVGLIRA